MFAECKSLGRPRRREENNIKMDFRNKYDVRLRTKLNWLKTGPVANSCRHDNESSGYIKARNFLTSSKSISFLKHH